MLEKRYLSLYLAAGLLVIGGGTAAAFSPDDLQIAGEVYNQLESQGYDVSNFENLTLSQITMIKSELDSDNVNAGLIRGVLAGSCGGSVILDMNDLRDLTN